MQTYLVHMRKPHKFSNKWNRPNSFTFQLIIGGKIASMFINPFMWSLTILYFVFRETLGASIEALFITPVFYIAITSLIIGNFLYMYYYMMGCARRGYFGIIKYVLLTPFYWLFMSAAAWTAIYLLIKKPHHWSKTLHGLHLKSLSRKRKSQKELTQIPKINLLPNIS